ncbi:histidine kinase [Embleya sp. NPDC001921]
MRTRHHRMTATPRTAEFLVLANLAALWALSLFGNLLSGPFPGMDRSSASFLFWISAMSLAPALQILISLPRFAHVRARYGGRLLVLDLLIVYAPVVTPLHLQASVGFPLASTLILIGGRLRWLLVAAQLGLVAGVNWCFPPATGLGHPGAEVVTWAVVGVAMGVEVYAITRFGQVLTLLHETRQQAATTALAVERLRAGRDIHDVLGLSMTAIVLRLELARRAVVDGRCPTEHIDAVWAQTNRALADVRAVTAGERLTTLGAEIEATRSVLAWAGVDAVFTVGCGTLPPDTDAALALVLREAITNVLRHSTATRCEVTATRPRAEVVLTIDNDGVGHGPPDDRSGGEHLAPWQVSGARVDAVPVASVESTSGSSDAKSKGSGLTGLQARLAAVGGTVRMERNGSLFRVSARVPPTRGSRLGGYATHGTVWLGAVLAVFVTTLCIRPAFWSLIPSAAVGRQILLTCAAHVVLFHLCRPRPNGARPGLMRSALVVQTLLACVPVLLGWQWYFPAFHPLATSVLFLFRRPFAVVIFAVCAVVDTAVLFGVVTVEGVFWEAFRADQFVGWFCSDLLQGLYVQFLLLILFVLAELRNELGASRAQLARATVMAERLRFGRDLRDRLGSELFAVARSTARAREGAAIGSEAAAAHLAEAIEAARRGADDVRAAARGVSASHHRDEGREYFTSRS